MVSYVWVNDPPISEVTPEAFRGYITRLGNAVADENVQEVLRAMDGCLADQDSVGSRCYAYVMDGMPVSLMIMSGGMSKKIDELVGHPQAEGSGSIMVEYAVNIANGRLTLDSLNANSTGFWKAMGAVESGDLPAQKAQGGCKMKLVASESPKWISVGNKWRLKKYADQGLNKFSTTQEPG